MEHLICYLSILKITEVFNTAILIGVYILRNLISGPLHGDLRGGDVKLDIKGYIFLIPFHTFYTKVYLFSHKNHFQMGRDYFSRKYTPLNLDFRKCFSQVNHGLLV